ncbi:hypothetical protein HK097_000055 [Rhizophlyctis rosea]|uniref:2-dehydropantoate 2-reductase n=1 Tax=Rhizophlyctis rosea TaxID=64517 RepID=A0AAD5X8R2_9FUNG|nr:hypothetical protein HK097_000055 [Rhizophlyctis rosea]
MHQPDHNIHVSVVCRTNYYEGTTNGFAMDTINWGTYTFRPHRVFASVEDASKAGITWNHVVLTTKVLPEIYDLGELVRPAVTEGVTAVYLFQNGVGIEESVWKASPRGVEIFSCVLYIGVSQKAAGQIHHAGLKIVEIGPYTGPNQPPAPTPPPLTQTATLTSFIDLCTRGGLDAKIHPDIQMARWMKSLWNASFGMVGLLSGCTDSGDILDDPDASKLVRKLMLETKVTAKAVLGRDFPSEWEGVEGLFAKTAGLGHYKASILLDWEEGKPTELEVLLGNIVRMARRVGAEVPLLESVYAMLKLADKKRRKQNK